MTNRAEEIDGKNKNGKYLKGSKKRALHEKKMKLRKNKRKADKAKERAKECFGKREM